MNNIDLVYLWVDGSDPEWQHKKEQAEKAAGRYKKPSSDDNCAGRFQDNGELKYSLRSIARFAPWIGNIFIVTDRQHPAWLELNHPQIHLIDHRDILPEKGLPNFNSSAIEWAALQIPQLSEYFLYANDDTFLNAPVAPKDFFTPDGKVVYRVEKTRTSVNRFLTEPLPPGPGESLYPFMVKRMRHIIFEKFKIKCNFTPHHNIDAYRKSHVQKAMTLFGDEIIATMSRPFRNEQDFHRSLITYLDHAENRAKICYVKTNLLAKKSKYYLRRQLNRLSGLYPAESLLYIWGDTDMPPETIFQLNNRFFCLNDGQFASTSDRKHCQKLLQSRFPDPSPFEKKSESYGS